MRVGEGGEWAGCRYRAGEEGFVKAGVEEKGVGD